MERKKEIIMTNIELASFADADLLNADFTRANLVDVAFYDAKLKNVCFDEANGASQLLQAK